MTTERTAAAAGRQLCALPRRAGETSIVINCEAAA